MTPVSEVLRRLGSGARKPGPSESLKTGVLVLAVFSTIVAHAATLEVGPGKAYAVPSAAIVAARDGDTIRIDPAGSYDNEVALIAHDHLTIESSGDQRVKIKTDGRVFGRKGIWVFAEGHHDLTIRGIEFSGAKISEADGANGAGLRSQGTNLTVTNCRFHDNQDGILGGGGTTTITHCEFDHNGPTGLTHNLYINDQAGTLIFRFNNSHDSIQGHLLKSRCAVNIIEFNRLSDDNGTGSYELDLPNGGECDIVGNIIHQSARSANGTIIAYGEEGVIDPKSHLNLIHNTIINDRENATFVDAPKLPADFKLVSTNNLFVGPGRRFDTKGVKPVAAGDIDTTMEKAGFVDPAKDDLRLKVDSPAAGTGVTIHEFVPAFEYVDWKSETKRAEKSPPDAGARSAM
jgi:hypothetical protein